MKHFLISFFLTTCFFASSQTNTTSDTATIYINNTNIGAGWDYYWLGDYKNAIISFDKGFELKENYLSTHIKLYALCKQNVGDYSGAMKAFNDFLALENKSPDGYSKRAGLKYDLGDYSGAIKDYTLAIKYENEKPEPYKDDLSSYYGNMASCYAYLKQDENALKNINLAIFNSPKNGYYHFVKGSIYYSMVKDALACEEWSKAGELGYMQAYDEIRKNCK